MSLTAIIVFLIVGAVAGWLAGQIVKGRGFGLVGNIVVGIIGAVIAGFLLPMAGLEIGGGMIASIINAVIGAVILLVIISFVRKTA
ncbi:MAG: GlsB/YeaQ/YmgE family stress response membrane protein [Lysobacterales bacterium]